MFQRLCLHLWAAPHGDMWFVPCSTRITALLIPLSFSGPTCAHSYSTYIAEQCWLECQWLRSE
eukprot:2180201-Amphidinium_carterae.1